MKHTIVSLSITIYLKSVHTPMQTPIQLPIQPRRRALSCPHRPHEATRMELSGHL